MKRWDIVWETIKRKLSRLKRWKRQENKEIKRVSWIGNEEREKNRVRKYYLSIDKEQCDQKKNRQMSIKVAQNAFTRKIIYFETHTKIA